ncbi:Serine threonine kinase, isoform 5 [Olea europaea subsp. europaea]|uniref:Serine threonine kinase, isoform 5 n=1 Tax=Olea europaea subsp. europaea TaxID=158383 RepID=A0A8S0S9Z7_OLEEU|nr:Serine threonine kinase, isoform 5 [Olea europaea subsp. europaea]
MGRMRELFEGVTMLKYQQPDEDLDALVSVVNDDDVTNMMEEYDKLCLGDGITSEHHVQSPCTHREDPHYVRAGTDFGSQVLQDQLLASGSQIQVPTYAYGADNLYQVPYGHIPTHALRRNAHSPIQGVLTGETSISPQIANGCISNGFISGEVEDPFTKFDSELLVDDKLVPQNIFGLGSRNDKVTESVRVEGNGVHGGCKETNLEAGVKEVKDKVQEDAGLGIELNAIAKEDDHNVKHEVDGTGDLKIDFDNDNVNISKIEPTKAEAEAIDRGLQWKGSNIAIKRIKASCFAGKPSERERLVCFR